AAHLFVFYYAVLADVTPPVAVTAFAGAQMAGADPMRTGWQASRVALSGFLAPFLFVYQPALLMRGAWTEILVFFACAVIALSVLSAAAAGHMFRPLGWLQRLFLIAVALAAISTHLTVSVATSAVLVAFAAWDWSRARSGAA
ncbi:MAG: TRAP transporter large permease subunit, partial [Candidatus Rokubacteria bacterium]|nr:TRAP transporter large permease subunit [Candidatus Rokubacteria bacterium]